MRGGSRGRACRKGRGGEDISARQPWACCQGEQRRHRGGVVQFSAGGEGWPGLVAGPACSAGGVAHSAARRHCHGPQACRLHVARVWHVAAVRPTSVDTSSHPLPHPLPCGAQVREGRRRHQAQPADVRRGARRAAARPVPGGGARRRAGAVPAGGALLLRLRHVHAHLGGDAARAGALLGGRGAGGWAGGSWVLRCAAAHAGQPCSAASQGLGPWPNLAQLSPTHSATAALSLSPPWSCPHPTPRPAPRAPPAAAARLRAGVQHQGQPALQHPVHRQPGGCGQRGGAAGTVQVRS